MRVVGQLLLLGFKENVKNQMKDSIGTYARVFILYILCCCCHNFLLAYTVCQMEEKSRSL